MSNVREVISALEDHTAKAVADLARRIVVTLEDYTPIRTGFARSNWIVSFGSPFDGLIGVPGDIGKATVDFGPHFDGIISLAGYTLAQGDIYVSNNADYIQALNDGHSAQAPAGYVQNLVELEASRRG